MNKNLTILLIDDDIDDRQLFKESVKDLDEMIDCIVMPDCDLALEYMASEENKVPDYIFLDLRMPGHSGRQCLIEINSNKRLENVPVIIYTTSTDVADAEELMEMGATHFLSKPVDPDEIFYIVSQVINEKWK